MSLWFCFDCGFGFSWGFGCCDSLGLPLILVWDLICFGVLGFVMYAVYLLPGGFFGWLVRVCMFGASVFELGFAAV